MLTNTQQALMQAIEQTDLEQVQSLLSSGLDPNFLDPEKGPPISVFSDGLFAWWELVSEAYEANRPMTDTEKMALLQVHLAIFDALVDAGANVHLWDSDELYGPLWDAASAACAPVVKRLLELQVDPNTRDEDGLTILSSVSQLLFEQDFDSIDWSLALPEEEQTLKVLRQYGAKMTKELQ